MNTKDIIIATFVIFLWALNLPIQKIALEELSVSLLNFLRLAITVPLIPFSINNRIPFLKYLVCGLFLNVFNFMFIGYALHYGMEAGISSFVLLTNSIFGILFCLLLLKERPRPSELYGASISMLGIGVLSSNSYTDNITILGYIFLIASAMSWGAGFALVKKFKVVNTVGDIVWLSAISAIPLLFISLFNDGPSEILYEIQNISFTSIMCILYSGMIATIIAGSLWYKMSHRNTSASMVPFILLMPVFTCVLSLLMLGEEYTSKEIASGILIILGVFITQAKVTLYKIKEIKKKIFIRLLPNVS